MALTDRPDIELNDFQREKTGVELDIRYQNITEYFNGMEKPLLQALVTKAQERIAAIDAAGYGGSSS